jgi:hypothetical protein
MPAPITYSFLDVQAAIVGPGGSYALGNGAGVAEEGITVEPEGDIDSMNIGADGTGQHNLIANYSGKVTVRLLKTSPVNALLSAMQALQRSSGALHGQNTLTITNTQSGDTITCEQAAFAKVPRVSYTKEAEVMEWEFNAIKITEALGAGVAQ